MQKRAQKTPVQPLPVVSKAPWRAASITLALVLGVSYLDRATGPHTTFTLLYLVPIAVSTYWIGRGAGLVTCAAATILGLVVALQWPSTLAAECWNAGVRLGVFVVFCTYLDHLHRLEGARHARATYRLLGLAIVAAGALAGLGWAVQREWPAATEAILAPADETRPVTLADLSARLESVLRTSKPVMLGSRDPSGPSCVTPVRRGEVRDKLPSPPGDLDGGPGTTMATLYTYDRRGNTTAVLDFEWHQRRLRSYLENLSTMNQLAGAAAHELARRASRLAEAAGAESSADGVLAATGYARRDNWPSYCLSGLDEAVRARNGAGVKHWSGELAAACFALDDLHRWLGLLCENQLTALDFQSRCRGLFEWTDTKLAKYDGSQQISAFPAGVLSLNGWGNYAEVERQAEMLYSMPPERLAEISRNAHLTSGSLWIPPAAREAFLEWRGALSADNQRTWDQAARTPYEHSYLVCMLYRARSVGSVESVARVLRKLDGSRPNATVAELMSVLMYRGHSYAGIEWSDRFEPELLAAAEQIQASETDDAALMAACRWTNQIVNGPSAYGSTPTLRAALAERRLDCVRATDMIGAIFRNAGRAGFGHVRWCAGTSAHSVAAHLSLAGDGLRVTLADGLAPAQAPEVWPECYFGGHRWPAGMESNPTPYAVELYVRGLDNYLWAEGYVVHGPDAGTFCTARLPYAPLSHPRSSRKLFAGPYPN